jgi:Protein of unknown function (DUF2917)
MQAVITNKHVRLGRGASQTPVQEIQLARGEVFILPGDQRGVRLESVHGLVWVTQPGDREDHWLRPGESVVVSCKGKVVVTGLPGSTVRVA